MPAKVLVVHHIDTEGPLCEPVYDTFKRIETTFHINLEIETTQKNLLKLQQGCHPAITDQKLSKAIQQVISPHQISFKESWTEVDDMLFRIMDDSFRLKFPDSNGSGWQYNWHIMDHIGFSTNERRRDMGYLNIFNHYEQIIKETSSDQDEIHWHFHPIPFFKEAHIPATSYENSYHEIHQVICRRLIEKKWFPKINRPGFHAIRPDSNWFLEQWMPFDASNQSIKQDNTMQMDATNGRFGDWVGATDQWEVFRPDLYNWKQPGNLNRVISRVLNLDARNRNITQNEIEKAFRYAKEKKKPVYLGITNHDFREMSTEITAFQEKLLSVAQQYEDVPFEYSGALSAFRKVLGYLPEKVTAEKIEFSSEWITDNVLKVHCINGEPFGPQPYLAIKTKTGDYFHDNFDFGEFKKEYYYTFDRYTIEKNKLDTIGIACNDKYGNTDLHLIRGS